jgi:hypothetical protein
VYVTKSYARILYSGKRLTTTVSVKVQASLLHNKMPSIRPKPSSTPSNESISTAIIVSVLVGVLGLLIHTYVLYQQRLRQTIKTETWPGPVSDRRETRKRIEEEEGLETGVIEEPLPVYQAKPMAGERVFG